MATIQNSARAQQSESSSNSRPPAPGHEILIANPRLTFDLTSNDPKQLQISNRERMAVCRFARPSRPQLVGFSPATRHLPLASGCLIATPRLELLATATKQNSSAISNRCKTPFFASRRALIAFSIPPSRSSSHRLASSFTESYNGPSQLNLSSSMAFMPKVADADPNQS